MQTISVDDFPLPPSKDDRMSQDSSAQTSAIDSPSTFPKPEHIVRSSIPRRMCGNQFVGQHQSTTSKPGSPAP